jgi:hypothetical protein
MDDRFARHLVELNGRAALGLVRGLIDQAERNGEHRAAEVWRGVETQVRKVIGIANDNGQAAG